MASLTLLLLPLFLETVKRQIGKITKLLVLRRKGSSQKVVLDTCSRTSHHKVNVPSHKVWQETTPLNVLALLLTVV